jgi:rhodanese-related sulfurtransferase
MKINYLLASIAVVAGLSAAFTNHAEKTGLYPTWKFEKHRVGNEKAHLISATHLADLIYSKERGIVLVDFRSDSAFQEYHIPSAIQHIQLQYLSSGDTDVIVLYGTDQNSISSMLQDEIMGDLYILKGGIQEWYNLVLFPDFEKFQVRNQKQLEEVIIKSRYFGGAPQNMLELNIEQRSSNFREGC